MKASYALAAAIAPLLAATGVQAQVVISNTRTTPILTSTAQNGSPANVTLNDDGAVELASGVGITGDSDNDIVLEEGSNITIEDSADGSTGILLQGGRTGSLTVGGAISINDTQDETEDEDDDGDDDGPLATGRDRYGVRVTGTGARTGDITIEDTGSIFVEGEDSVGLSLETNLVGDITAFGSISAIGAGSRAIDLSGDVSGDVLLSGSSVSASGEDAVAVSISGDIGGRLQIQSSLSSNGFRYTSQPTSIFDLDEEDRDDVDLSDDSVYLEDLDADDLLQSGSGLIVAGNVAGGILLDAAPTYEAGGGDEDDADFDGVEDGEEDDDGDGIKNEDDDDVDGDGIDDENESTASITTYGSAPAVVIGSATSDVTIGQVGTGEDAFGLVNRGSISALGVYDGIEATGLRIGVDGGGAVTVSGGVRNEGTISASASEADSVGFRIGAGATVPAIVNDEGSIQASTTSESTDVATALLIEAGATVDRLENSGTIAGVLYGESGDAVAVRDLSGTLTLIENSGSIYGTISATDDINDLDDDNEDTDDEDITGREIALDLRANTTGVTLIQTGSSDQRYTDTDGDDIVDAEDPDDDDDGIPDEEDDEDNDDDNDGVYDFDEPLISGEILLGSGADTIDLRNGTIASDIAFGDGADRFEITGGGEYEGEISDSDGQLDLVVENGVLDARQATATNATSLTVGADGQLIVTIDPEAGNAGGFALSGAATFENGAALGIRLSSLIQDPTTYTIVSAGSLDYGITDTSEETAPYLTVATFAPDFANNAVTVDLRRRTASEMSLSGIETAAYEPFYDALARDEDVRDAFLAAENREDFINLYEQTLPDHSGGTLASLAEGVDAVTRALADRNVALQPGEVSGWLQEINFYADTDKTATYGYRAEGFGVAGGYEKMTTAGVVGLSMAVTSSDLQDPEAEAEEVLSATLIEMGLYWRAQGQAWSAWARGAVGYASFNSVRTLVDENIEVENEAEWDGYTLSAAAGASYQWTIGRLTLRPEAYAEVFSLSEGSRRESGGGDSFDLEVDDREGHLANAVALVNISYGFGQNGWIRPNLRLGWKHRLAYDAGETVARYLSGGDSFVLDGDDFTGGGPILGFGLSLGNAMGRLTVSGDAQLLEDYVRYSLLLRANFRF